MDDKLGSLDLEKYLARIHEAGVFDETSLLNRLLSYLIKTELNGEGSGLKAYTIGLDVFGKPDSFDPSKDSSVRVAVGRLRTALTLFESSEFADTDFVVEIPVGTYRPKILPREKQIFPASAKDKEEYFQKSSAIKPQFRWAASAIIACLALGVFFFFLSQSPKFEDNIQTLKIEDFRGDVELADQTTTTLRRSLSQNQSIVVTSDSTPGSVTSETDLILSGVVNKLDGNLVEMSVELSSVDAGNIVWAKAFLLDDDAELQQRIEQGLGSEIRIRIFGASKEELAKRDPEALTPEQLFLLATWVPGPTMNALEWEQEQIRLMSLALDKDQDFGSAHSVMADKLTHLANLYESYNSPQHQEQALAHIQSAKELAPLNPDVMFNVAQAYWHSGKLAESAAAMERVVELDPSHGIARFLAKMIPHTCRPPSLETVEWAKNFDSRLSTNSPIRWLTLSWIANSHFNRGEDELALGYDSRAELIFDVPYSFMRRAMLLDNLGQTRLAKDVLRRQEKNWPDIDPMHFAEVTLPRLCGEEPVAPPYIAEFQKLAASVLNETEALD